jgi:hypothetical protein
MPRQVRNLSKYQNAIKIINFKSVQSNTARFVDGFIML